MGSRTWFKIYPDKWMDGTIRQEQPDVRAVFVDLLALACASRWGDAGEIKLTNEIGWNLEQLSHFCGVSIKRISQILDRLIDTNRISVAQNGVIIILNWAKYQSEYERQRGYRNTKKVTNNVTTKVTAEIEIEKEKEIVLTNCQQQLLSELRKLPQWGESSEDVEWLIEFKQEFPKFWLQHIRGCRDYHSKKSKHSKALWKTRLRNWMGHERQVESPDQVAYQKL